MNLSNDKLEKNAMFLKRESPACLRCLKPAVAAAARLTTATGNCVFCCNNPRNLITHIPAGRRSRDRFTITSTTRCGFNTRDADKGLFTIHLIDDVVNKCFF